MAKSGRASVIKRNRAKLRATVFGPAVDARTERLSAKLQELASQPKPNEAKTNMELDSTGPNDKKDGNISNSNEDMDIDQITAKGGQVRTSKSGRIQKRQKKSRSSIVFRPHQSKAKGGSKRR
ncbi:hypothetical protein BO94DRAFT_501622 [Aspergillus sclerotioniger CBS 115572]|uniref:DUF2423 domain-containing protein n=1 Tax=Aspergillus sclerotioniger CBS 115572 TaxID=1450535 RepID=A0A317VAX3_9EURO|nr:hypothetical protein BO94DRAFT_501622 [Aspergillus sclerotioniger CBS 115572]PWY71504.1 hypothetical protein BO94DRAFT_501622 [Aspergillus sclerotioniger CBS 115572]